MKFKKVIKVTYDADEEDNTNVSYTDSKQHIYYKYKYPKCYLCCKYKKKVFRKKIIKINNKNIKNNKNNKNNKNIIVDDFINLFESLKIKS
jgi:hypothetical protein